MSFYKRQINTYKKQILLSYTKMKNSGVMGTKNKELPLCKQERSNWFRYK